MDDFIKLGSEIDALISERGPLAAMIIRGSAEGAIPNGSLVQKCNSVEGDTYLDGTVGMVIASHSLETIAFAFELEEPVPPEYSGMFGYFVIFASENPVPLFILGNRIMPRDM